MNRTDLRRLINSAFSAGRPDYARTLCQGWLRLVPGDLGVRLDLARAYAAENNQADAHQALLTITNVDLESAPAYQLLAEVAPQHADGLQAAAAFHVLTGFPYNNPAAPDWMAPARQALIALSTDHIDSAREQIELALRADPSSPFLSLLLLQTHWRAKEIDLALPLAKGFHDRWPKSLAFSLCLIEGLFRTGNAPQAVELLHSVSALDSAGEVVARYWGEAHRYRDLWPRLPDFNLPGPIPAEIIALLGLNRLPAAQTQSAKSDKPVEEKSRSPLTTPRPVKTVHPAKAGSMSKATSAGAAKSRLEQDRQTNAVSTPKLPDVDPLPEPASPSLYPRAAKSVSEELRDIESTLNTIAAQIGSTRANRKPVHVILFSPKLLTAKFGPDGADQVLKLIGELAKVTAKRRNRIVVLLTPEAPPEEYHLKAVDPAKAWDVKMLLHDLESRLAPKQLAITSLLIIGGDDLLPFHRLPNPTDDADEDVPSDNPYATLDENYFIPEWPVGRLPSPCGRDPEPLCKMLQATIAAHQKRTTTVRWMPAFLFNFLQRWINAAPIKSLGYSANIWKEASVEVFAPIGSAASLQTCPPLDSENAPPVAKNQFSYFNLHGVEDGPNWYGQRTEADGYGPLYPIAFTTKDVAGDSLPNVIYTEACYGANIINKVEPDAALCLRFLTDGVSAFVGSTRIAYGSVATPLIGADMLGRLFWENLLGGLNVGEALCRAKLSLAHTMHKRQSFLDGEDQKTLISFLLYGDPLLTVNAPNAKGKVKKDLPATLKTVAMEYEASDELEAQPETVAEIKSLLAHYLPGSESARVSLSRPLSPIGAKSKGAPTHRVYTFAKNVPTTTKQSIPTYARVTVNKAGKVVKIAVSR
jgi:tetratricopeptide (TPR) repeat protein